MEALGKVHGGMQAEANVLRSQLEATEDELRLSDRALMAVQVLAGRMGEDASIEEEQMAPRVHDDEAPIRPIKVRYALS
jgi:hypothetical protein